jgi:hypothetical protein
MINNDIIITISNINLGAKVIEFKLISYFAKFFCWFKKLFIKKLLLKYNFVSLIEFSELYKFLSNALLTSLLSLDQSFIFFLKKKEYKNITGLKINIIARVILKFINIKKKNIIIKIEVSEAIVIKDINKAEKLHISCVTFLMIFEWLIPDNLI